MADPLYFDNQGPFALGEISQKTGASLPAGASEDLQIDDVAPLDVAGAGQLSFFDNRKYLDQFKQTKAAACFVSPDMAAHAPEGVITLETYQPYKAYALAAQMFYPQRLDSAETVIEDGASVHETATIGKGCLIEAGARIGRGVVMGDYCRIGPNAVISHTQMGDYTRVYPGACIGQDGFGFAIDPAGFVKVPQLGRVIIGSHVEIGSNTTIDRGAGPDTVIGDGTWIDNLVQIGHNVKIGRGCVIVAHVGISGSTILEDFVMMGGQSGVAGHLRIGTGARIGAQSGIMKNVPAGAELLGSPAIPIKEAMRQIVALKRLIKGDKSS